MKIKKYKKKWGFKVYSTSKRKKRKNVNKIFI